VTKVHDHRQIHVIATTTWSHVEQNTTTWPSIVRGCITCGMCKTELSPIHYDYTNSYLMVHSSSGKAYLNSCTPHNK
jgi:hypothetical protein